MGIPASGGDKRHFNNHESESVKRHVKSQPYFENQCEYGGRKGGKGREGGQRCNWVGITREETKGGGGGKRGSKRVTLGEWKAGCSAGKRESERSTMEN